MSQIKYYFPIEAFYEPSEIAKVNDTMEKLGFSGRVGFGAEIGGTTMTLTSKDDKPLPDVPDSVLDHARAELQKILDEHNTDTMTLTVKEPRRVDA